MFVVAVKTFTRPEPLLLPPEVEISFVVATIVFVAALGLAAWLVYRR